MCFAFWDLCAIQGRSSLPIQCKLFLKLRETFGASQTQCKEPQPEKNSDNTSVPPFIACAQGIPLILAFVNDVMLAAMRLYFISPSLPVFSYPKVLCSMGSTSFYTHWAKFSGKLWSSIFRYHFSTKFSCTSPSEMNRYCTGHDCQDKNCASKAAFIVEKRI